MVDDEFSFGGNRRIIAKVAAVKLQSLLIFWLYVPYISVYFNKVFLYDRCHKIVSDI